MVVQYIQDRVVFASNGNDVYQHGYGSEGWQLLFRIPLSPINRLRSLSRLTRRLFRCGISDIVCIDGHTLALVAYGSIYTYDLIERKLKHEITPIIGSRPLTLCKASQASLYYGEYRGNPERSPVHVFGSEDGGRHWQPVYQFRNARHIHGVFWDPYSDSIWITTGDTNEECGIWVTQDCFMSVKKVLAGNQQVRAVRLLFTQEHIYFGSDTPTETNYLYRILRKTRKVERIQKVESSVFWGCKVGDQLFFSTAVEPSKVNKCREACIWGSKDGENWKCVARFRKDIWPMKLFQYGQVLFPSGENNTEYLWFTPFATEKHMTVQRLNVRGIF